MVDQISNVKWLWWRLEQEVKATSEYTVAVLAGYSTAQIRRILDTHKMRMGGLLTLANRVFHCSVAELFIDPNVETDWYKDAKPEYIPTNLRAALEETGRMQKELSDALELKGGTSSSWFTGRSYPGTENLQKIADYFEMEVADLFLPPKGVVE